MGYPPVFLKWETVPLYYKNTSLTDKICTNVGDKIEYIQNLALQANSIIALRECQWMICQV